MDNGLALYLWIGMNVKSDFTIGNYQLKNNEEVIPLHLLSSIHPLISILFNRQKLKKSLIVVRQVRFFFF